MHPIYLDHNSTSPLDPLVRQTMIECYEAGYANPASQHRAGRRAHSVLEDARDQVRERFGLPPGQGSVIFTSGGTEANNLAILGLSGTEPGRVLISSIEHPSVGGPAAELARRGFDVRRIHALASGEIDLHHFRDLLTPATKLVSVMLANHETGVLQPLAEVAELCHSMNVPLHTDAVQAAGYQQLDIMELNVTALTITAHKFRGPLGIGVLVLRDTTTLLPQLFGGFHQAGLRPGTESVALAVSLARALELCHSRRSSHVSHVTQLRDHFESLLLEELPATVINGRGARRLPQTSNVSFPGVNRQALFMALDLAGLACSTGSACASGSSEPSPVLLAMGLSPEIVEGALRFSFSPTIAASDAAEAARRILACYHNLRP